MKFQDYDTAQFYDEMFARPGKPRPGNHLLIEKVESLARGELVARQKAAEQAFYDMGITFSVYGHEAGTEKIFPFDIIPRIIQAAEWDQLEKGLKQRIYALNLFIDDIYHDRKIIQDGVIPEDLVESSQGFFKECMGINPPHGIWCHITGTDLVRDETGTPCQPGSPPRALCLACRPDARCRRACARPGDGPERIGGPELAERGDAGDDCHGSDPLCLVAATSAEADSRG